MTRSYYKDATAAIIVFDCTNENTFKNTVKWKEDLDAKIIPNIPSIILANKCDLVENKIPAVTSTADMQQFVTEHKFDNWFETSAKSNANVDTAIMVLIKTIMKKKILN